MITVQLRKLLGSSQALGELSNLPLKGKVAFRFAKVVSLVNIELEALDKARENLVEQYVKDREAVPPTFIGKNKKERAEAEEAFNKDIAETLDFDVELNTEKIAPDVLDEVDDVRPLVLSSLSWLFEE